MKNTLVDVKNLSVSYFTYAGEVQSVRGISFSVENGKTTALVGESGCGKSVTSKALMGLIEKPGKIVESGKNEDIFYDPRHPYTWALMNSVPRLDLDNKEELVTIEGTIPDMIHPPKGCAFCSRCPYAMNVCAELIPEVTDLGDGHTVACWLNDPRADISGVPFRTGGAHHE